MGEKGEGLPDRGKEEIVCGGGAWRQIRHSPHENLKVPCLSFLLYTAVCTTYSINAVLNLEVIYLFSKLLGHDFVHRIPTVAINNKT